MNNVNNIEGLTRAQSWRLANKERSKLRVKKYYELNKELILTKNKAWSAANREKLRAMHTAYRKAHRVELRAMSKAWRSEPLHNVAHNMRYHVHKALAMTGTPKEHDTFSYIGCSPAQLKEHLEKQFKPGMSWDNRKLWHINHVRPISSFTVEDIHLANHYTNLQPLWAFENFQKGSKLPASLN